MAGTGPGKFYRKGISIVELIQMFPDDSAAEKRWKGNGGGIPSFVQTVARWILAEGPGRVCPIAGESSERRLLDKAAPRLDISQKSAWFMQHRIRQGWQGSETRKLNGPVEGSVSV